MPLPDSVVTEREKKQKRRPEASPYRWWKASDPNDRVPWLRVGYFDGWDQVWVVEGRVRSPQTGKMSRAWRPVGQLSSRTGWFWDKEGSQHFIDRVDDLRREIAEYDRRSKEWIANGGTLRDLNIKMARENGTLEDGQ